MDMARFKYSAQVFGYIAKPLKNRLVQLRRLDPQRYSESRVIGDPLDQYIGQLEGKGFFNEPIHVALPTDSQLRGPQEQRRQKDELEEMRNGLQDIHRQLIKPPASSRSTTKQSKYDPDSR